jgi:hypothetical protein
MNYRAARSSYNYLFLIAEFVWHGLCILIYVSNFGGVDMTTKKEQEKQDAVEELRALLKPGDTLHTVLRYKSSSGMSRGIDVYLLHEQKGDWLSYLVAKATGFRFNDKNECLSISGCGMDMGFHVVNTLSAVLFPDGFACIGEGCPANDHSNGDRDYTPGYKHGKGAGAYAIQHEWL